jgi:hypothetical protein
MSRRYPKEDRRFIEYREQLHIYMKMELYYKGGRNMLNIFKKKKPEIIKVEKPPEKKIQLATLLDLIKNGDRIGLKIEDHDSSDSMNRILKLDGVEISVSEWSPWTLDIELIQGSDRLVVYRAELTINWSKNSIDWYKYSNKPLEVEWTERGPWCEQITSTIEKLKNQLDAKRRKDVEEQELRITRDKEFENQQVQAMKAKFNDIYKK